MLNKQAFNYDTTGRLTAIDETSADGAATVAPSLRTYSYVAATGQLTDVAGSEVDLSFNWAGSLPRSTTWLDAGTAVGRLDRAYDSRLRLLQEEVGLGSTTRARFSYNGDD